MGTHKGDCSQKTNSPRIGAGEPPENHSQNTMRNTVNSLRDRWDYFFSEKKKKEKDKLVVIEDKLTEK